MNGPGQKKLSTQYAPLPVFGDPYRLSRLEVDERELIDSLFHVHRGRSQTVNLSDKALLKRIPEVNAWIRENPNRNHARIMNRLLDGGNPADGLAMAIYPLVQDDPETGALDFSLRFVVSFEKQGPGSGADQIGMLRDCNAPVLERYLDELFDRPRRVAEQNEHNPGTLLAADREGRAPDFRFLSAEKIITHRLDAQLEALGLKAEHLDLFYKDLMGFFAHHGKLREFFPGLYLPAREDIFAHDEIVFCYRVTADALETFVRHQAPALGLSSALTGFDQKFPPESGRRQKRERVSALLEMVAARPGGANTGTFQDLDQLSRLVRALLEEMGRGFEKRAREEVIRKVTDLFEKIREKAAQSFDIMRIIPDEIFSENIFKDPEQRREHSRAVIERLKENQELAYVDRDGVHEFAFLPLLFRIEAELERRGDQELARSVHELIEVLPQLRPGTRSYKEILRDYDPELYRESQEILGEGERKKKQAESAAARKVQSQINLSSQLAGGLSIVGGVALYGSVAEFDPLVALNVVLFSYLAGVGLSYNFLKNRHDPARVSSGGAGKAALSAGSSGSGTPRERRLDALFPQDASAESRIHSRANFMQKIGELQEVSTLSSADERRDAVETIMRELQPKLVMISVPRGKVPAGHPSEFVLDRRDIMASAKREKIVRHFRKKSADARKTGTWSQELADYHDFVAGQIEASFLKNNRRAPIRRG